LKFLLIIFYGNNERVSYQWNRKIILREDNYVLEFDFNN